MKIADAPLNRSPISHASRRNGIIRSVDGKINMNDLATIESTNADTIRSRILTIRGVQVMLSRDLAYLYEVEVKHLHRQVKRNADRFSL